MEGFVAFPDAQADLKLLSVSLRLAIFNVTMFCEPMSDVMLKILQQFIDIREGVRQFSRTMMPMIAFSGFVVVAQNANTFTRQGKSVFVAMTAAGQNPRKLP
jgi:hypothetical protein